MREFYDLEISRTLYLVLVQPHLSYGILGWGGVTKSYLKKLEITQQWLLKMIYRRPNRFPTEQLYRDAGIMDLRKLFLLTLSIHQRKSFLLANMNEHRHETRNRGNWIIFPRTLETIAQRSHIYNKRG